MRYTIPYITELRQDWEEIRKLDERENWTERTQVVTKEDHKLYIGIARVRNILQYILCCVCDMLETA